jgi:transglutaminase-like putative cysteine protease
MLIKIGYDIALQLLVPTSVIFVLRVHPSRKTDLIEGENFRVEPNLPLEDYFDTFQNHCGRVNAPSGIVRFRNDGTISDSGEPDRYAPDVEQLEVSDLPISTLAFLLPSRYCEVDSELLNFAWNTFGKTPTGWARVRAICDFVHNHLSSVDNGTLSTLAIIAAGSAESSSVAAEMPAMCRLRWFSVNTLLRTSR